MRVAMIVDGVETYPPYCPFGVMNSHHSVICGNPDLDGRKTLYCDYVNDAGQWVDTPSNRCPLKHASKLVEVVGKI